MAILAVLFFITLVDAQSYGCDICKCDFELNFATCQGPNIVEWPDFPYFQSSMRHLSFLDTFLSKLPYLHEDEYTNLSVLQIINCPFLNCSEIVLFAERHENIDIITDKNCVSVTSDHPLSWSDSTLSTVSIITTDKKKTDKMENSTFVILIIILVTAVVCLSFMGLGMYWLKKKQYRINSREFIFEMDDMHFSTEV